MSAYNTIHKIYDFEHRRQGVGEGVCVHLDDKRYIRFFLSSFSKEGTGLEAKFDIDMTSCPIDNNFSINSQILLDSEHPRHIGHDVFIALRANGEKKSVGVNYYFPQEARISSFSK